MRVKDSLHTTRVQSATIRYDNESRPMTTINTIEDFLRIMRQDDEWRSAVRRELLTEEVLALPQRISTLAETVNALAESIEEYKSTTSQRLSAIEEHTTSTDRRLTAIEEYANTTNQRLTRVEERLDRQHGMLRRQHDDLARFRGNYAIEAARQNDMAIAQLFAHMHGLRQIDVRALSHGERRAMLIENQTELANLGLWAPLGDTFLRPDLIAEVTALVDAERPQYYIAVEASFTAHDRDIARATDHAKIVRCATGRDTYAVIAAVRLDPTIDRNRIIEDPEVYLHANDEDSALWYPIVEDELEPADPC